MNRIKKIARNQCNFYIHQMADIMDQLNKSVCLCPGVENSALYQIYELDLVVINLKLAVLCALFRIDMGKL